MSPVRFLAACGLLSTFFIAGVAQGVTTPVPSISFVSSSGYYVETPGAGGSNVIVDRLNTGGGLIFIFNDLDHSVLTDGDHIQIQAGHGQYLTALCGGGTSSTDDTCGVVMATATVAGPYETFVLSKLGGNNGPTMKSGDNFTLKSSGGFFCTADVNGGGPKSYLSCRSSTVGAWQTFQFQVDTAYTSYFGIESIPSVSFLSKSNFYMSASGVSGGTTGLTPFPSFPVSAMRLWDVAPWAITEPSSGTFNWTKMDGSITVGQAHGVKDFIYSFGHLPTWAALTPNAPCKGGEGVGTCSPPIQAAYDDYATAIVKRYCGVVEYYEPWNEPNNPQFWSGTNAQLLSLAQDLYRIAKDPANCGCTNGVCTPGGGANPNKVLLPPSPDAAWLSSYLSDAGAPYSYADVATFHGNTTANPESVSSLLPAFKKTLATYGLSNLPLWNTEGSWDLNSLISTTLEPGFVMRYHVSQWVSGVSRVIWYGYENCTQGTLWVDPACTPAPAGTSGQMTDAGIAYGVVEKWLTGADLTQCQLYQNGLWACELKRPGGSDAWMVWSSSTTSISVPIPAGLQVTNYRDFQDTSYPITTPMKFTQTPVLLETTAPVNDPPFPTVVPASSHRVYPNPWRSHKHVGSPITFDEMTEGSDVKIFTVSGHQVKELSGANGKVTWDLTNDGMVTVSSGIYLYLISDDKGNKTTGKLTIIK